MQSREGFKCLVENQNQEDKMEGKKMDERKGKTIEQVKEAKVDLAKSQTWRTERETIIKKLHEINFRERQLEFLKTQQEGTIKQANIDVMFLKEDLYFLTKGRDLVELKKELGEL